MQSNPWPSARAPWHRRAWDTYRAWSRRTQWIVAGVAVFVLLALIGAVGGEPDTDEAASVAPSTTTTTERPTTTTTEAPTTTTARPTTTTTAPPTTTTTAPPTTTTAPPTTVPPTTAPPTLPPTTSPPPTQPPSDCHPNYDPCIPIGYDADCAGGEGDGPIFVEGPVYIKNGADPYGLDGNDNDGIGCES
ncbi:MAG TPA: hypothetical protein VGB14_11890 [Acidimicrobiales bacterium]